MRLVRVLLTALVLIAAVRLVVLFSALVFGSLGVARHHVEATATVFAILAVALKFLRTSPAPSDPSPSPVSSVLAWLTFCLLAIALYWPSLWIGLLSDDYVLMKHASEMNFSAVTSTLFRPIPLMLWAAVLGAGGGPVTLHLLNVVLHGTNAYLGTVIFRAWIPGRQSALAGGLLLLSAPLAPEAVAWCSGIFDVSATTCILSAVLVATRYATLRPLLLTRFSLAGLCLAAVLSKETAAIAPLLIFLYAWSSGRLSRTLLIDLAIVLTVIGVYGGLRVAAHPETAVFAFTKYAVQRALFTAFGSLAVPYHDDLRTNAPWILIVGTVALVYLWTQFSIRRGPRRDLTLALTGSAWILIAVLPAWPILVVPGDLQASRFLYLAATGWSLALVVAASSGERGSRAVDRRTAVNTAMILIIVLISFTAVRVHLGPWVEAGQLRDHVLSAAANNQQMDSCASVRIVDLPDNVRGAYVFRNGVAEALLTSRGITVVGPEAKPSCHFRWTADHAFVPISN